jgi:hypothetical protein
MIAYAVILCDPALAPLYTPAHPQLGRYEVCTTAGSIDDAMAETRATFGPIESLEPLDAFGGAGRYDPAALARLYGGRRASVTRGWRVTSGKSESLTLISPYPNAAFTALERGTMIIRWELDRGL